MFLLIASGMEGIWGQNKEITDEVFPGYDLDDNLTCKASKKSPECIITKWKYPFYKHSS